MVIWANFNILKFLHGAKAQGTELKEIDEVEAIKN